jgi:hypothetical protein
MPLTMYVAFFLFAFWGNQLQAFLESLARGDLLLLCVSLLSLTWNWWQEATKKALKRDQEKDSVGHALATGSWVMAVFLAMVYGGLLIFSLPNMPPLGEPISKAIFCGASTVCIVTVCGFQYYRLLSQGRL